MLRMQIQNSPQSQVQVVQSQPQIIQVRFSKYFYNYNLLVITVFFFIRWPHKLMDQHQFTYLNQLLIHLQVQNKLL